MFLTARILFLNEEDYLREAVLSVYPAVDRVVILEGCIREYGKVEGRVTREGLSVDRSAEILHRLIRDEDPEKKIEYVRYGFAENYAALANAAVKLIPLGTTHFLNIDADEVYRASDILQVREMFEAHEGLCGVAVERIHFYLDFWTVRWNKKMRQLEPVGGTMFRRFYRGERYPERAAEHNPQLDGAPITARWLPWTALNIRDGIAEARSQGLDGITLRRRVVPQFHYGWVRGVRKMKERVVQTMRRTDAYSGQHRWKGRSDAELIEYSEMYNPIWTGVLSGGDELGEFEGVHPQIMRAHPFYHFRRTDFGWPESFNLRPDE
jgi:hypothetical protein